MTDLLWFAIPLFFGAVAQEADRRWDTSAFFWILVGIMILSGGLLLLRACR